MSVTVEAPESTAVRPFTFEVTDAELADLKARINATRWPEKEPVDDRSQGVRLETIQAIARYWANDYDWRKVEARLQALPHFITEIDGLDIHFIHVRSKHEDALPCIVTHGWPGSIIEQLKIIEPLTNPTAHGADASDAFHLVIPSMPGYGWSGKPAEKGWDTVRIARAWGVLMERLGYDRYVATGGDWGALVVDQQALQAPAGLIGIHTNMAGAVPPAVNAAAFAGEPSTVELDAVEQRAFERITTFYATDLGYAQEMATHPQSLYGISDSPVALAAWMLDHDDTSHALIERVFNGASEGLSRDDVLDNTTYYWLTNTGISSGRLYCENKLPFFEPKGVELPVAVSVFYDEIYAPSRRWVEAAYPNLIHFNALEKGCHFAAWEQPELFCEEVRTGFRSLR